MTLRADFDAALMNDPVRSLAKLEQDGTVRAYLPEVQQIVGFGGGDEGHKDLWGHTRKVVSQCVPKVLVRWAALYHDVGKPDRFHRDKAGVVSFHGHEVHSAHLFRQMACRTKLFSEDEVSWIWFLVRYLGHVEEYDSTWTDSAVRRLHKEVGSRFEDVVALARADITTKHADRRAAHHARMHELRERAWELAAADAAPPALVTGLGHLLSKEFNVSGRGLGNLMGRAREAVEAGKLERQASPERVIEFLNLVRAK